VGEFWILLGAFRASPWTAAFAATGVVLGAVYMLTLYQRMMLGKFAAAGAGGSGHAPVAENDGEPGGLRDLDPRELSYFIPLIALMVVMGLGSTWFTDRIDPAVRDWLQLFGRR